LKKPVVLKEERREASLPLPDKHEHHISTNKHASHQDGAGRLSLRGGKYNYI
jgi:hypothetical protein